MKMLPTTSLDLPQTSVYSSPKRKPAKQYQLTSRFLPTLHSNHTFKADEEFAVNTNLLQQCGTTFNPLLIQAQESVDEIESTTTSRPINPSETTVLILKNIDNSVLKSNNEIREQVGKACNNAKPHNDKNEEYWESVNENYNRCHRKEQNAGSDVISSAQAYALIEVSIKHKLNLPSNITEKKSKCSFCITTKKLEKGIRQEMNTLLDLQFVKYEEACIVHKLMITSIKRALFGNTNSIDCTSFKALIGTNVHSLLHILYLVEKYPQRSTEFYNEDVYFIQICVRCSSFLMAKLNEGCLNKQCIQHKSVKVVFDNGFCALIFSYYSKKWKCFEEFEKKHKKLTNIKFL